MTEVQRWEREAWWEFMTVGEGGFWDCVCCPHTPNSDSQYRERYGQGNSNSGQTDSSGTTSMAVKYSQCFTFSKICYVTALCQNGLNSLFSSEFY